MRPRKSISPKDKNQDVVPKSIPKLTYYRSRTSKNAQSPFDATTTKKTSPKLLKRVLNLIIIAILVFCLVYIVMLKPDPEVNATSNIYGSSNGYKNYIKLQLRSLPNRNKITLDEQRIIQQIEQRFPEVESVDIKVPLFSQKLKFDLDISSPAFILSKNNQKFLITRQGKVISLINKYPNLDNLITVEDQSYIQPEIGKQILSTQSTEFITNIKDQLNNNKIPIESLTLPNFAQEIYLKEKSAPYFVKFYLAGNSDQQIGQYLAARKQINDAKFAPAEYLDVRVEGKVFYK